MNNPGQQAVCQSTDGRVARNENTQRRVGAPPKVYLIASWAALALCVAASATFFYFALKEPDGHFSLDMLTRWENLHPQPKGRTVYLALAMLAVPILLAAIYWIRAARGPVGTQCS
jgi:hypothetical protein